MSAPHSPDRIETLLAERAWVRRLAGALVRNAATADNLVQDAYVAVLERGVEAPRVPCAWMGTILTNLACAELVERLARLVLELPEPYRTVVVLRFFEDEAPRRIAASMETPVEAVRIRLRRALAMLEKGLDETRRDARGRTPCLVCRFRARRELRPGRGGTGALGRGGHRHEHRIQDGRGPPDRDHSAPGRRLARDRSHPRRDRRPIDAPACEGRG